MEYGMLLNGVWRDTGAVWEVRSPYDGALVGSVAEAKPENVTEATSAAMRAMKEPIPAYRRADILESVAKLLKQKAEDFSKTLVLEAGKPIKSARGEVERAVSTLTVAASEARNMSGEVIPMGATPAGAGKLAFTVRVPIGVVGAITPFNFPLNLVCHKLAPAIAAGCAVVLKPAERTPISAIKLAQLFLEAGLPPGWLNVLVGDGPTLGAALVNEPNIALITFTGSGAVGWSIREQAPRKKVLLELGNSSPVLVFDDGDVEAAASTCARNGFSFSGQSCISVQRAIVHRGVADEFEREFLKRVSDLVVGDPMDESTDVGPLISKRECDRVLSWIDEAQKDGAMILSGGRLAQETIVQPTVLSNVKPEMKVFNREIFGPVVVISRFDHVDEAVELANATEYGLQAGVYTNSLDRAIAAAGRLQFASVLINEAPTFRADQMPYGGWKESGNTREGPKYAMMEMTEPKLIVVNGVP
ncbi:MAG: aldehyde dehydrogenase family protein [Armatimonadetes bacterium]|nr:aldehyde dehydrogenase family protein [Armatimonadota bacterium]